jgi:hypothetical protein
MFSQKTLLPRQQIDAIKTQKKIGSQFCQKSFCPRLAEVSKGLKGVILNFTIHKQPLLSLHQSQQQQKKARCDIITLGKFTISYGNIFCVRIWIKTHIFFVTHHWAR